MDGPDLSTPEELAGFVQRTVEAVRVLRDEWLEEDEAACMPGRGGDGPVSGGGVSDPTARVATGVDRGPDHDWDPSLPSVDVDKYRGRDRIGSVLARADFLVHEAEALRER